MSHLNHEMVSSWVTGRRERTSLAERTWLQWYPVEGGGGDNGGNNGEDNGGGHRSRASPGLPA